MTRPRIPRDEPLHPVVALVGSLMLSLLCWAGLYELVRGVTWLVRWALS